MSVAKNEIQDYEPNFYRSDSVPSCIHYTCKAIEAIVIPIFLAVSIGLIINYAINPGQFVQLTSDFSMSLPLLICSSIGASLTIYLVIQIAVLRKHLVQNIVRQSLHCGSDPENDLVEGFRSITLSTRDNIKLRGLWHFDNKDAPTVIVFGGNAMAAYDAVDNLGKFYKNKQYNVLLVDYRGYGVSQGIRAGSNQEMEAYYDAEAALKFVLGQGIDKQHIVTHGYSLGGSYAAALGYFFGVSKVILDHTFTSLTDIAFHLAPRRLKAFARFAVNHAYKNGKKRALDFGITPLKTDGFNTMKKVKQIAGQVLVIQGENDHLMPIEFGRRLSQGNDDCLFMVEGGHMDGLDYYYDPDQFDDSPGFSEAATAIERLIQDSGASRPA